MGIFKFLKDLIPNRTSDITAGTNEQTSRSVASKETLCWIDKERIMVERITTEDMKQIVSLPYHWNCDVRKFIEPRAHPFAYVDLIGPNIGIANNELEIMNAHIRKAHKLCAQVPLHLSIPVNKILFTPTKEQGYTRLMCTPYTYTGQPSLYPAHLSFMTDLSSDIATTHGELFYGQDGSVKKATIYFWRKGSGYFLYYATVDGELVLEKIEYTGKLDDNMRPSVIYKAPHILALEAQRVNNQANYQWLQENLPDKCPKSFSGYCRMKNQNTKNFQSLKELASARGREL